MLYNQCVPVKKYLKLEFTPTRPTRFGDKMLATEMSMDESWMLR